MYRMTGDRKLRVIRYRLRDREVVILRGQELRFLQRLREKSEWEDFNPALQEFVSLTRMVGEERSF